MAGAFPADAFQADAFQADAGAGQSGEIELLGQATVVFGGALSLGGVLAAIAVGSFSGSADEPPPPADAGFQSDAFQNDAFQTIVITGGVGDIDLTGSASV